MLSLNKIRRSIDLNDLASVKKCLGRLWSAFQLAKPTAKRELLGLSELIRGELAGRDGLSYEWKQILRRIDGLLELMRKAI
jgi:hypothetical protein